MSIVRWNPVRDIATFPTDILNVQREINRMFDGFFRGGFQEDIEGVSAWMPSADLAEHENELVLKMELPGVAKDDLKLSIQDNMLTVRGEKKKEIETKESNLHRLERSYGTFQRSFMLPSAVKADKIEASCTDGVLSVVMPKADEAKPKQIAVRVK